MYNRKTSLHAKAKSILRGPLRCSDCHLEVFIAK